MTAFLIAAALMLVAALFFILPTLLRKESGGAAHVQRDALNLAVLRDQLRELDADRATGAIDVAGYESARQELERRVAEDVRPAMHAVAAPGKPWTAIAVAVMVPAAAAALYWFFGTPAGLDPLKVAGEAPVQTVSQAQIVDWVNKLAARLKEKPDDAGGWDMLARSYNTMGRFGEAADAYAHLVKLAPPNAALLADYADSLAMSLNKNLQGEPEKLINRALEIDPNNIKALALSGGASFERHDYLAAIAQWKKIQALAPPDSEITRSVTSSIAEAQTLAGLSPTASAAGPGAPAEAASGTADQASPQASAPSSAATQVSGTVELDAALRPQVADTDSVFIFARAAEGPRFPLAVLRKQVKDLPITFVLDDSMSMMPNARISAFPLVMVGARISKTGSATPSAGDLEGLGEPVHPGAKDLKIRINSVHK
ncbi:MAG: c-type cytochrome biogenesis protein CcmI [Burkholderiales bacterium]